MTMPLATPLRRHPSPSRERGAALLIAMIIVTLVATLASAMVWQQWRAVQVESAERARAQSAWILSGALDFGRHILRETAKGSKAVTLSDPWAAPLAEARLSTFLAVDKSSADDGPEAFLAGNVTDAQAKYNLTNLIAGDPSQLAVLVHLCKTLGVNGGVADRIATGLRDAQASQQKGEPVGAGKLLPNTVAQLRWLGIDAATVAALEAYVVILPKPTTVNVNTASKEVLEAAANIVSAAQIVQSRQRTPFDQPEKFAAAVGIPTNGQQYVDLTLHVGVTSDYFEVRGRLRLADHVLTERSLVHRESNNVFKAVRSERIASLEQAG